MAALFGTIFLPVGISFFFVLKHHYWLEGIGAVLASLGFFYVARRADDILGMNEIQDTREISLADVLPQTIERRDTDGPPSSDTESDT